MIYWIIAIAILDLLLGAIVAIPSLFAIASLIGNAPGAAKITNQILAGIFMGLPLVCVVFPIIGIILYYIKSKYALLATCFPWIYFMCLNITLEIIGRFFR